MNTVEGLQPQVGFCCQPFRFQPRQTMHHSYCLFPLLCRKLSEGPLSPDLNAVEGFLRKDFRLCMVSVRRPQEGSELLRQILLRRYFWVPEWPFLLTKANTTYSRRLTPQKCQHLCSELLSPEYTVYKSCF
jgi:hypothetical protein